MRRMLLVIAILSPVLALAPKASAGAGAYAWELDPPPVGMNMSAAGNGSVLTLLGGGSVDEGGTGQGRGVFEITDKTGNVVSAGTWTVSGRASVQDQGPLPEEVWDHVAERGIVHAHITLEGVGTGTITVFCAAGPKHLEGFRARIGHVTYSKIVSGSSFLMRVPV